MERRVRCSSSRGERADGWPIKVAIVATPSDLGDVGALFTRPQEYADLLARENRIPRLLVVTPVGIGGQRLGAGVDRGLSGLHPVQPGSDRLERQALTAVQRLAALDGHRVTAPEIDMSTLGRRPYRQTVTVHRGPRGASPRESGGGSAPGAGGISPLLFAAPIALAALLLGGATLRVRSKRFDAPDLSGERDQEP